MIKTSDESYAVRFPGLTVHPLHHSSTGHDTREPSDEFFRLKYAKRMLHNIESVSETRNI